MEQEFKQHLYRALKQFEETEKLLFHFINLSWGASLSPNDLIRNCNLRNIHMKHKYISDLKR
jgi:hypothetical protein